MTPHDNLKSLGLKLPEISTPGGSYVSVNVRGNIAYIAIQFPILNEEYKYQGCFGNGLTTDDGYKAMQFALSMFWLKLTISLDSIS